MKMETAPLERPPVLSDALILAVCSFTLYFYDYILTFEREVRLFWMRGRQNMSAIGVLFCFARYIPMVTLFLSLSLYNVPKESLRYYGPNLVVKATYWLAFIAILSSEGILIMRTYALWGCSKRVVILLTALLFALALPYCVAFNMARTEHGFNRVNTASYALILGFETVIISMTLYRRSRHREASSTPLLRVLYRDGIAYYLFTLGISLVNLIIVLAGRRVPTQLNVQYLLHSILATRIVLHIRGQGEVLRESQLIEMSPLQFQTIALPASSAA